MSSNSVLQVQFLLTEETNYLSHPHYTIVRRHKVAEIDIPLHRDKIKAHNSSEIHSNICHQLFVMAQSCFLRIIHWHFWLLFLGSSFCSLSQPSFPIRQVILVISFFQLAFCRLGKQKLLIILYYNIPFIPSFYNSF